ncbi:MAG: hypothetical protein EOO09_15685 [Chitinophagaceae bacterium]|nr:MAG: hypothetical protein EOO09_15685 [Chitinophagaceae bacterium]
MYYLADQREQAIALVYRNMLLDTRGIEVLGIVLGNCVFDATGKACAKYFKHVLYDMDGRILARDGGIVDDLSIDPLTLKDASWEILEGVTDHSCPVIEPLTQWSAVAIKEHFRSVPIGALTTADQV